MGSTLVNTSSKLPPVEQPQVANCTTSEAIMSFADFAGPECDPFFLPSKEDSDVEVEPTDQGDTLIDEENEEITEIPEKYQIHQGMYSVFGDSFINKISTCQWHFKRCAWRQLVHIQEDDRASFREAVHGVCNAKTAHEYDLYASMLDKICSRNKVVRWWNWWKVRRYHLVLALRGFGWTSTNWAELGQSKLKKNRRIGLMDAVLEDIIHALNEYVEWLVFVDNTGKTTGKGSTVLKKRLKERKDLRAYAQSIIDALQQGNLLPDMVKHRDPARHFIANCAAKHRVPRTYPLSNPTQEDVPKHTQKGPGRGKSSTRGVHGSIRGRGGKGRGFISAASLAINDDEIGNDAAAVRDDILVGIQDVEEVTGEQLLRNDTTSASTQGNTTSRSGRGHRGGHVIRCGRGSAGGRGSRNGPKDETSAVRDATKGRQRCRGAMLTAYEPRRNPERERRGYNPRYRGDDYSTDEECHPFDDLAPTAEQEKSKIAGVVILTDPPFLGSP